MSHERKHREAPEIAYGSNAIRLNPWQWILVAAILAIVYLATPPAWKQLEAFTPGPDFRIPYALSEDYWLYKRYASMVCDQDDAIPIVGDSVVWGQYVRPNETLSHFLNAQTGTGRFANLGVNGSHPAALSGLMQYYGGAINGRKVILHYNPLWMTSERRDLSTTRILPFNHPRLVAQFYPEIPCYEQTGARRLAIVMNNVIPFLQWTAHMRTAYFENKSFPDWTLAHPYANPVRAITLTIPDPEDKAPSDPVPWVEKGTVRESFAWVDTEASLQWRFFRETLSTLRSRGNEVLVILGPFNEHMITDDSRSRYSALKTAIEQWFAANEVDYVAPDVLPSEVYADASHPIAQGYDILADRLLGDPAFQSFTQP